MRFSDKVCVVGGGGFGMGGAAYERFASEGGNVTIVDIDQRDGRETVEQIVARYGDALFTKADVSNVAHAHETTRNVGERADIAAAICFRASHEARFITGTTLVVDGARLDIP